MLLFFKKEVLPSFLLLLPSLACAETYTPQTLPFPASNLTALAWSPDGARIAACALSGPCRVWNAATGTPLATAPNIGPGEEQSDAIIFSPDGQTLLIDAPGGITIWPWSAGAAPHTHNLPAPYINLGGDAFHACGPTSPLVETTGNAQSSWALHLNPATFAIAAATKLPALSADPACLPATGFITPDGGATPAQLRDLTDGRLLQQIHAQFHETPPTPWFQITAVAAAPDHKLIAVGAELEDEVKNAAGAYVSITAPYSVRLVAWPQNRDIGGLFPNNTYVFTLAFSPDSRYLAAALNHQAAVQRLAPPGPAKALTAPSDTYEPLAFSPTEDILAVGAGDRVLLFDMKNVY